MSKKGEDASMRVPGSENQSTWWFVLVSISSACMCHSCILYCSLHKLLGSFSTISLQDCILDRRKSCISGSRQDWVCTSQHCKRRAHMHCSPALVDNPRKIASCSCHMLVRCNRSRTLYDNRCKKQSARIRHKASHRSHCRTEHSSRNILWSISRH